MKKLLLFLGLWLPFFCVHPCRAGGTQWDEPFRLTSDGAIVRFSAIAADSQGDVHAFWVHGSGSTKPTDLVFYRGLEAGQWGEPIDLFAGFDGERFSLPAVAVDHRDRVHLIWNSGRGLYYSSTPARRASDLRSWQSPSLVVRADAVGQMALVVAQDQTVHVVYARRQAGTNLMYVRTDDLGATWSMPQAISFIGPSDEQVPDSPHMATSDEGDLHVVWAENYPPEYVGRQILYANSGDNGRTWTTPKSLSELTTSEGWNHHPRIVVDSFNDVHVTWAGCGDPVARCYRKSTDQGSSWSGILRPFESLVGSAGPDALAADPYGNVLWAGSLRSPQAVYFSVLPASGVWLDPPRPLITREDYGALGSAHFPQMAVGEGNQLHMLLVESDGGPLWYLHGQTAHPRLEASARATPTPHPTLAVESPASVPTAVPPTSVPQVSTPAAPQRAAEAWRPLAVSSLSVLGVLTVWWALVRHRRR